MSQDVLDKMDRNVAYPKTEIIEKELLVEIQAYFANINTKRDETAWPHDEEEEDETKEPSK